MHNPITARFRWTEQEFLTGQHIFMRHSSLGRKHRRTLFVVAPLTLLFGAGIFATRGFHPVGCFLIIMAMAIFASPLFGRRISRKHYAQRSDRDMEVSWEFYPDRLVNRIEASSASFEWRIIIRVLQSPQGFHLCSNDLSYHWVPIHAFAQATDSEAFAQLAKSKVQRFEKVG